LETRAKCENGVQKLLDLWISTKLSSVRANYFQQVYSAMIGARESCLVPFDRPPVRKLQRILETPCRAFLFRVKEEFAKVRVRSDLSYKSAKAVGEFFQKGIKEKCVVEKVKAMPVKGI